MVEAHRSPLCCIAPQQRRQLLATASETGTIIRVFSVPQGPKLFHSGGAPTPSTIYGTAVQHELDAALRITDLGYCPYISASAAAVVVREASRAVRLLALALLRPWSLALHAPTGGRDLESRQQRQFSGEQYRLSAQRGD